MDHVVLFTLFPGDVPSESVAKRVVTLVPMATSSSSVTGEGMVKNTGGISLRSSTFIMTFVVEPEIRFGFSNVPIINVC